MLRLPFFIPLVVLYSRLNLAQDPLGHRADRAAEDINAIGRVEVKNAFKILIVFCPFRIQPAAGEDGEHRAGRCRALKYSALAEYV